MQASEQTSDGKKHRQQPQRSSTTYPARLDPKVQPTKQDHHLIRF